MWFRKVQKPEDLDKKLVFSLVKFRLPRVRQLRLLSTLLTPYERWIIRGALAVVFIAGSIVGTRFLKPHLELMARPGGVYREAVVGSPRLVNPILANTDVDRDLTRLLYSSLLRYNAKGELTGDLVDNYRVEDEGRTFIFTLRDGLHWHDGEPITSADALFTLEAIANPVWRSAFWRAFQGAKVEAPDAKSVRVTFPAFQPSLPYLFTVGILPKHLWQQVDPVSADRAIWNLKPVGSGPWQFAALGKSRDGEIRFYHLKRNVQYHGGAPHLKEMVLSFFTDFESALEALRVHRVQGVSFVPDRLRAGVPSAGVSILSGRMPRFTALFFQDRRSEFLAEKAVRRALHSAIDRAAIASLVPDAQPLAAPFLEHQLGYLQSAETGETGGPDLEAAAQLLTGAGWKRDEEGWLKNQKRLSLTLTVLDEPILLTVADALRKAWEALGVKVTLEAVAPAALEKEALKTRSFEILLFSLVGGADPDPYAFWHSSQIDDPGLNLSSVRSRGIDVALEQGRAISDPAERFRQYLAFRKLFEEEVPGIILYASPYRYAISKKVRGVSLGELVVPADRFNGVEKWFMRWRPRWK